jgi:tetratricopeptide (TPR) repeat protein
VWKEYYATLSYILQHDLPYPTTAMATVYNEHSLRLLQRNELARVESRYEGLLLKEVQFPRADEASEEVEEWVDMVMRNWRVLSSNAWDSTSLGSGGKDGLSRGVLDILYRAATRTYHSTRILRHLFTVHLAIADFDLAFKAFDTYFELVKKAKQRVAKTGEQENGLDDDEDVLKTAAQCIRALCRFGELEAAEKAKDLAQFLESYLAKHEPPQLRLTNGISADDRDFKHEPETAGASGADIRPSTLAHVWRAIGVAQAQWARLTFDAKARSEFQAKAIKSLERALDSRYGCTEDVDTLFTLALLLAERRDIGGAIKALKQALSSHQTESSAHADSYTGHYARERSQIPLWHLLALLLSAKEEFTGAQTACEAAFRQFGDLKALFGDVDANGYHSEHLNGIRAKTSPKAAVDEMDDFEKERILEVKMTQLVLVETMDGPGEAINRTEELLGLYTRLFGEVEHVRAPQLRSANTLPPSTSHSTLRSVRGSIFGRSRRSVRNVSGVPESIAEKSSVSSRPATSQTNHTGHEGAATAPQISVINEKGETTRGKGSRHSHHEHHKHSIMEKPQNLVRKQSQSSVRSKGRNVSAAGSVGAHDAKARTLGSVPHSMAQKDRVLQDGEPNVQDTRMPNGIAGPALTALGTRFNKAQARRHRVEILVRVWLLIAGFYRRAEQWGDAKGAVDAAGELVEGMEREVVRDGSGHIRVNKRGWGVGKCVEELWADVWAEVSLTVQRHVMEIC